MSDRLRREQQIERLALADRIKDLEKEREGIPSDRQAIDSSSG